MDDSLSSRLLLFGKGIVIFDMVIYVSSLMMTCLLDWKLL